MKMIKFSKGVSFIEVLMVIAIISILASAGVGGYLAFKKGTEIDLNSQQVANLIRNSQGKAKAMKNDNAWGIDISSSRALIFKGTNFSSRDSAFDEITNLKGLTGASGKTQIIFDKLTGLPDSAGTLALSNGETTKNIQINAEGLVSY